ncbi:hypothetical protein ACFL6C_12370 [Myxococcota bacterium]
MHSSTATFEEKRMRLFAAAVGLVVVLILANPGFANTDDQTKKPVVTIKDELMYVKVGFGHGLGGVAAFQNGEEMDLGFFGGNVETYFDGSPEALEVAKSFSTYKTVGFAMWSIGMATLLADLGILIYIIGENDGRVYANNFPLIFGLLIGGAAVGLPGVFLFQHANSRLVEAVNIHNAALMNQFLPDDNKVDFKIFALRGGAGAGLAFRF